MNNKHENHNNNTAEIALKKAQTSIKNILGMIEADAYRNSAANSGSQWFA